MELQQKIAWERRQKVEAILAEMAQHAELDFDHQAATDTEYNRYRIDGKIGKDLRLRGVLAYRKDVMSIPNEQTEMWLEQTVDENVTQRIGGFMMQNRVVGLRPAGMPQIKDTTEISVFSPAWDKVHGETTASFAPAGERAVDKLLVFHAKKEDADQVIDRIYTAIEQSKLKAAAAQKLRKLNAFNNDPTLETNAFVAVGPESDLIANPVDVSWGDGTPDREM